MPLEKELLVASAFPAVFQWRYSVPIMQIDTGLPLGQHWVLASASVVQWYPSVLVAPVVFQCVPIMQINTGSPLGHHWV